MAKKVTESDQLFAFNRATGRVFVTALRKFGNADVACASLTLRVEALGLSARQIAVTLGASEDQVLHALWDTGQLETRKQQSVSPRMYAISAIASEATFTDRHTLTIGALEPQRVHLIKGISIVPREGLLADATFSVVIQTPGADFMGGIMDALRDPLPVQLRQDPELPFADVKQTDGEDGGQQQGLEGVD